MSTQQRSWNTTEVSDRRTHVRRPVYLLSYISLGEKNGGVLRDISEGGLALQAAEELTDHESLRLRFRLPKSREWIETDAKIVWRGASKRDCGIEFIELPESARCEIEQWLGRGAPSVRSSAKEQNTDSNLFSAAEPAQSSLRENPPASQDHRRNRQLDNQVPARPETQVPLSGLYGAPDQRPGARVGSPAARRQSSPSMQPPLRPVPDELYQKARFEGAGYWNGKEAHRKSRRWGFALCVAGTSVALALGGVVALGPATLRDQITERISVLSSAASHEIAALEGPQTAPTAPTTAPANDADSPTSSPASSPPAPVVHSDTLPANQDPAAALPVKTLLPVELQPQPEVAATPRATQSSREKGQSHRELKSPVREAQNRKSGFTNVAYRMKRGSLKPQPLSRTPEQVVQSPSASRQVASAQAPPDASGSYTPAGFLDLPGAPISASGAIAITSHRTIPIPAGPVPQTDSGQSLKIGSLVYHVDPIYPAEAERTGVQGTVELHLAIGPNGNVESVEPVSGPLLLIQAAMSAVRQWQYGPTLHYGNPIPTEDEVNIVFRLP